MQVVSFTRRQDRAASSRSVRLRHSKENALCQGGTGQGIQQTQPKCLNHASLATETRIRELGALMDAAAKAGDLDAYKVHQAERAEALKSRSPEQAQRLNELHLAAVERAALLGDHGLRFVPVEWLETETGRAVAWSTSRPIVDEADWRAA
jgi:hypothetical protein